MPEGGEVQYSKLFSTGLEGLLEVGDEIFSVFDATGNPDHVVGDAELPPLFGRTFVIAHHQRLLDQRLDATQAWRYPWNPNGIHNGGGLPPVRVFDQKGNQSAESAHRAAGEFVLRVARQTGVIHFFNARVTVQKLGNRQAVRVMPLHP